MTTAKHISDLLYRYECVILPEFGAFLTQRQSAKKDEETQLFYPPKKLISFNEQLTKNDGLLANYIADVENITYPASLHQIKEFVHQLQEILELKKEVILENIGSFNKTEEGNLIFEPLENTNYLTEAFGLSKVKAGKVNREVYKEQVEKLEKNTPILFTPERRTSPLLKYAAIGILAIGLSGLVGLNVYSNQVSKHNIAEQHVAESQLQQKIQQATFIIDNPLPEITFTVDKQNGNYHVVAGAFRVEENARLKVDQLKEEGFKARYIGENKFGLHQVVYASHPTRTEAMQTLRLAKKTNEGAWLLIQEL